MICYHGTTRKGLEAILNRDLEKPFAPWECCDNDGAMYFWPNDKIAKSNFLGEAKEIEKQGLQMGF